MGFHAVSWARSAFSPSSSAQELLPQVQKFLFCGEVTDMQAGRRRLLRTVPQARRSYNAYGPTETTVLVTARGDHAGHAATRHAVAAHRLGPFQPVQCRHCWTGTAGRRIAGRPSRANSWSSWRGSVSPGYLPDSSGADSTALFFRTRAAGGATAPAICCRMEGRHASIIIGRLDGQVKLNGFRVELEDVESNLVKVPNIARAAVLPVLVDGTRAGR